MPGLTSARRSAAVVVRRATGRRTDMSKASPLDRSLSAATAGVFATLAKLRRARGVHPHGIGFGGVLTLQTGPGLDLIPGLGAPRSVPAVLRLSRSFGLPRPLPDLLGVAVKLPDMHGPGHDQDFLLVSALDGRLSKYVPLPAPRYSWRAYSSLIPYRSDGRLVVPGALSASPEAATGASPEAATGEDEMTGALHAAEHGDLRFRLAVAPALGRFTSFGEIRVTHRLPQSEVQALRFNPFHTAQSLTPAGGPLNAMRRAAYPASQRARRDTR
jgi:hypothetical protein